MSSSAAPAHPARPLSPRQERILRAVVERFIATGVPVGSRHVAGTGGIDFASSTVRYELARLEDMGFLGHPHTSAGRVPTDAGYRYYVDVLLPADPPAAPAGGLVAIERALDLGEMRKEVDAALQNLAEVVSQLTCLLGVVTAPAPQAATVRHVEVLLLQPQLVMVVVITSTGEVNKRIFAFEGAVDPGLVEWARAFLNERVTGYPVGARLMESRLAEPSLSARERAFAEALAPAITEMGEETPDQLYVAGQARFLADARQDLAAIDTLMAQLEQRATLLGLLRRALSRHEVYLHIGAELPGLQGLSMVAANYGVARRNLGTISLIGPTRMDYRLAIGTVREAATALSRYLEGVYE
jgi:heat-inducible transcriptional repressor